MSPTPQRSCKQATERTATSASTKESAATRTRSSPFPDLAQVTRARQSRCCLIIALIKKSCESCKSCHPV
jgi:hypothetical protein